MAELGAALARGEHWNDPVFAELRAELRSGDVSPDDAARRYCRKAGKGRQVVASLLCPVAEASDENTARLGLPNMGSRAVLIDAPLEVGDPCRWVRSNASYRWAATAVARIGLRRCIECGQPLSAGCKRDIRCGAHLATDAAHPDDRRRLDARALQTLFDAAAAHWHGTG